MSADTPGVKTQLNFKTSQGSLVNVQLYSYNEDDIRTALNAIANVTPEINAVETLYNAQGTLKEALGATPIEQPRAQSSSSDGAKTCKHGEMQFRKSKPDAAKAWKGYFCPSPKGTPDQCEPQFIR